MKGIDSNFRERREEIRGDLRDGVRTRVYRIASKSSICVARYTVIESRSEPRAMSARNAVA